MKPAAAPEAGANSRERVSRAIRFRRPDRVPVSHAVLPAAQLKYGAALNDILAEFRDDFGWDYQDDIPLKEFSPQYRPGLNRDAFGTLWRVEWPGNLRNPGRGSRPRPGRVFPGRLAEGNARRAGIPAPVRRPHARP